MIKRLKEKKAGLTRYKISYSSNGHYHRKMVWARSKAECEELIAREQGLIETPLTWDEGAETFIDAKSDIDCTEGYLASVKSSFSRLPFKKKLISRTTAEELANHLQDRAREASPQTSNKERAQVLAVLNYLEKINRLSENPFKLIDKIKSNPAIRQPIPTDELYKYLEPLDAHTRPIIKFMAFSGLRASEACSLKEADIKNDSYSVRCKGGKIRTLSTQGVQHIFEEARSVKAAKGIRSPFLFTNSRGNSFTAKNLWVRTKALWKQAGLDQRITLHSLRHTFATALVTEANATLEQVAHQLGHAISSKTMTAGYVHITDDSGSLKLQDRMATLLQEQQAEAARQRFVLVGERA